MYAHEYFDFTGKKNRKIYFLQAKQRILLKAKQCISLFSVRPILFDSKFEISFNDWQMKATSDALVRSPNFRSFIMKKRGFLIDMGEEVQNQYDLN